VWSEEVSTMAVGANSLILIPIHSDLTPGK
jgi:hypothetical protein